MPSKTATPVPKKPAAKNPIARLTTEWASAKGKHIKNGDTVKTQDGFVIKVFSRWTARDKAGTLIPKVTGKIVTAPAGATASATGSPNRAAVASTLVHVGRK